MSNTESIQIHLNSQTADKYNAFRSFSDCDFYFPTIEIPNQHTILLSVHSAVIPHTFYNIDSTNNVFAYSLKSPNNTIAVQPNVYIPIANYNAIQLAKALTTLIPNMTVSYNAMTNRFFFQHSASNFILTAIDSTCFDLIGFTDDELYSTSILQQLNSFKCANLHPKQFLSIQTNLRTGNINHSSVSEGNVLVNIPINTSPYSLITYFNYGNFKTNLFNNNINYINIRICDQDNNLIDLNSAHWSISLQLDIVNLVEN